MLRLTSLLSVVRVVLLSGLAAAAPPLVTKTVKLKRPGPLGSGWRRVARIGYGAATSRLGTSPGGENGSIDWGPSYGTQLPDRTWWYADAAKKRLAHYSDTGAYLGEVKLAKAHLTQGVYFQWQNPQPLADGTVVLTSTSSSPGLLLLSPKQTLRKVRLDRFVDVQLSDGHRLYGFDEDGQRVRIAPKTGTITSVADFAGQGGHKFRITLGGSHLRVTRPGVNLRLNVVSADHPGRTVRPTIEVAMGAAGRLWILMVGFVELSPEDVDTVLGLVSVDLAGKVSPVSRIRTLTSESDPGDGRRLGMRLGGTHPWLMLVDTDALRVYRKK